eukprot:4362534-Amphidinium_carterae.1
MDVIFYVAMVCQCYSKQVESPGQKWDGAPNQLRVASGKPALIISVVVALLVMLAEACGAFPGPDPHQGRIPVGDT